MIVTVSWQDNDSNDQSRVFNVDADTLDDALDVLKDGDE